MKRICRALAKLLIIAFCTWHMAAVLSYSLYHVDTIPVMSWISNQRDFFRPYLLATSQWQRWNLFSPDPLRRVIEMDILQQSNGEWNLVHTINENNVGWWQRAPELKVMRRMEDENKEPLRERYVLDYCRIHNIPDGTRMRMVKRWFVIPKHDTTHSEEWWNNWEPNWKKEIQFDISCESI